MWSAVHAESASLPNQLIKNKNTTAVAVVLLTCATSCSLRAPADTVRQRTADLYPFDRLTATDGRPGATPPSESQILERANLELYISYGLHRNADLRGTYERWRAALERIPQVSSLPDPVFTFAQFVEEVQTRTGPQDRRYTVSQGLPWFGKLDLRGRVAGGSAEEHWQAVGGKRLDVESQIAVAFYEYGYLAQSQRITEGNLQLLEQLEPVVRQRVAAGLAGQQELLKLQVEIGKVQNDLASIDNIRPTLSARLAATMNFPGNTLLPLPDLTEPPPSEQTVENLLERTDAQNPLLNGLRERIKKDELAQELAGLERWPDLTVGVDYIETGEALGPVSGSGDDPWALRLGFTLPISRGRYAAAEREAERNLAASRYDLQSQQVSIRAELEHAVFKVDDAARQVGLYRDTLLPRARESLDLTRTAYTAGRSTLLELIEAERDLLDIENAYWRACKDQLQSQARLTTIVGDRVR